MTNWKQHLKRKDSRADPPEPEEFWAGVHVEGGGYRELIHLLKSKLIRHLYPVPILKITCPCDGSEFVCQTFHHLPQKSVSCNCGHENHWYIKYDKE